MLREYDKGYQTGYDAGYKRAMLDYGLEDDSLDKIRAEIECAYTSFRNRSDIWSERACGLGMALEIIDNYKLMLTYASHDENILKDRIGVTTNGSK